MQAKISHEHFCLFFVFLEQTLNPQFLTHMNNSNTQPPVYHTHRLSFILHGTNTSSGF